MEFCLEKINHLWSEVFRLKDIHFFVLVIYLFDIGQWYSDGVFIFLPLLFVTEQCGFVYASFFARSNIFPLA